MHAWRIWQLTDRVHEHLDVQHRRQGVAVSWAQDVLHRSLVSTVLLPICLIHFRQHEGRPGGHSAKQNEQHRPKQPPEQREGFGQG